jgi:hypothetical protein
MTEEECADCVLSDEETALLRELYVVHASREQRIMLCAPMFDHVFGDFETPGGYERAFAMARGFVSDKRPVSHISNPGYYRFKLRYKYGKSKAPDGMRIDFPYQSSAVVHSFEVCDEEEQLAPANGHVWVTRAGELPADLAACGGSVGIGGCGPAIREHLLEDELGGQQIGPMEFFYLADATRRDTLQGLEAPDITYDARSLSLRNLAFIINEGHRLLGRANDCRRVLAGLAMLLSPYEHLVAKWLYEQAIMPVGPMRGLCMHRPPTPAENGGNFSCSRPIDVRPVLHGLHPTFLNPMASLAPPPSASEVLWSSEQSADIGPEPLLKRVCFDPNTQLVCRFAPLTDLQRFFECTSKVHPSGDIATGVVPMDGMNALK